MNLTLEPVTREDEKDILALFTEDDKDTRSVWPSGGRTRWYWYWKTRDKLGPRTVFLKAVVDSQTVGFVYWFIRKADLLLGGERLKKANYLRGIIVLSKFRGLGIGRKMMEIAKPNLVRTNIDSKANGFYQRLGYTVKEVGRTRDGTSQINWYWKDWE